jgi:hypothetical protein
MCKTHTEYLSAFLFYRAFVYVSNDANFYLRNFLQRKSQKLKVELSLSVHETVRIHDLSNSYIVFKSESTFLFYWVCFYIYGVCVCLRFWFSTILRKLYVAELGKF